MSNVKCIICGEPWDYYGVYHGDMLNWEKVLFLKGVGCPCCHGEKPETGYFEPERVSDIEFGDDDPGIRLSQIENRDNRPEWVRPAPKTFWTCQECGISVQEDPDTGDLEYDRWVYTHGHREDPTKEPPYTFDSDRHYCEQCVEHCSQCSETIEPETGYHIQEGMDVLFFCSDECLLEKQYEDMYSTIEYMASNTIEDLPDNWIDQVRSSLCDKGCYCSDDIAHELLEESLDELGFLACTFCDGDGYYYGKDGIELFCKNCNGSGVSE